MKKSFRKVFGKSFKINSVKYFHGMDKKISYFEGWYLKHQSNSHTIAFIPAFHINADGKQSASIQIIMDGSSHFIEFPVESFYASQNRFYVKVGNNIFSHKGILIDIEINGLSINGKLIYGPFTMLKRDIMGPFRLIPFMQCNHGVLSLMHDVYGTLFVNDERIDYNKDIGYIEKDWGSSFPKSYLWTQCNKFSNDNLAKNRLSSKNCSVMLSLAEIPLLNLKFTGCICAVYYKGNEYILATYLGVKILKYNEREVIIKQNDYCLIITVLNENAHCLKAPSLGSMTRVIKESPSSKIRYQFYIRNQLVFDRISSQAGYEYSKE